MNLFGQTWQESENSHSRELIFWVWSQTESLIYRNMLIIKHFSVFLHLPLIWTTLHVHLMETVQSICWSGVSCWTLLNKPHRAFFTFMRGRKRHYLFWVYLVKSIAAFFSFYISFELRLLFCQEYPCLIRLKQPGCSRFSVTPMEIARFELFA